MDTTQLKEFQQKTKAFVGELREQLQHERQQKDNALVRVQTLERGEVCIVSPCLM